MKVSERRWGEVTIKKQGSAKNVFDATKSFSIEQTKTNYDIEQVLVILKLAIDLTEILPYLDLKKQLERVEK